MEDFIQQFLQRDASPAVQFIKYALSGGLATLVDALVFYTCACTLFPALRHNDPIRRILPLPVHVMEERRRSRNFVFSTLIAFLFSNYSAYLINIHWVFAPGRHAPAVEMLLFYAVSGVSVLAGTALGWLMIRTLHLSTTFSYAGKVVAALMINYVCRKYIIFSG